MDRIKMVKVIVDKVAFNEVLCTQIYHIQLMIIRHVRYVCKWGGGGRGV